jgi:hypothetical protein
MTFMPSVRLRWLSLVATGLALGCAALGASAGANDSKSARVYRWVDEHGVVHYGDRVPPQYAQTETTVLNGQGVEVGRVSAEQTPEELQASQRAQEQLQRQRQHDDFLLSTYTSVADIEQLRDERLSQLKGQRVAAEQYIAGLHERLLALQARAMLFKPYNGESSALRMPDDLAEQLVRTVNEMRSQRNALTVKDREESAMRAQFQGDIDRYRELRAERTTARQ